MREVLGARLARNSRDSFESPLLLRWSRGTFTSNELEQGQLRNPRLGL